MRQTEATSFKKKGGRGKIYMVTYTYMSMKLGLTNTKFVSGLNGAKQLGLEH